MVIKLILGFLLAYLLALVGVPMARRAALDFGVVDRPDGNLKVHEEAVPYLGGLAVFTAFLLSLGMTYELDRDLLAMLLASTIVATLGLIDDFGVLTPKAKVLGQLVAVFVLLRAGVSVHLAFLPPWARVAITVVWLVGLSNAFNLMDIMDGLASGVAVIAAGFLLVVASLNGRWVVAAFTVAMIGALLGFLKFNFPPAQIYLGDSGSMVIGMMIGSMVIMIDHTPHNDLGFLSAFFVVAIPAFDLIYVIVQRLLKGKSPFLGSPDHLALRLRKKLCLNSGQTSFFLASFQTLLWIPVTLNYFGGIWTAVTTLIGLLLALSLLGVWLAHEPMP